MKKLIIILLVFLAFIPIKINAVEVASDTVALSNCVDGNSSRFMLGVSEIKVKFIGIEVEETIKDETTDKIDETLVSNYVCDLLKSSSKLRIEYEPTIEKEDKFGRVQAWVFVDDVLLQEELVRIGYAEVMYLEDDFLYADKLKEAQKYAKENKLGIWKNKIIDIPEEVKDDEKEEKKPQGFFDIIINFFADLFNKLLKFIDDIIGNIL